MTATELHGSGHDASVGKVDMKLEVDVIPVSDVDRSKAFYERLGPSFVRILMLGGIARVAPRPSLLPPPRYGRIAG